MLTEEIQARLDAAGSKPAVLVPEGDVVYISNGSWLIVVTGASNYLSHEVLRAIETYGMKRNERVDWLVINARVLDLTAGQFTPYRARKSRRLTRYGYDAYFDPGHNRALVDAHAHSIYGEDLVDLSEMYEQGGAYPVYQKQAEKQARDTTITNLVFRFGDRVLAVDGDYFQAFHEMGFRITCPEVWRDPNPDSYKTSLPTLGLYMEDADPAIFGFLMPRTTSGIKVTDQGVDMTYDAAEVSWIHHEDALRSLQGASYYRPGFGLFELSNGPVRAIDALRWAGLTDSQIDELFEDGRERAYNEQHQRILKQAETEWEGVRSADPFQYEGYKTRAQRALNHVTEIGEEIGQRLDTGRLADIVDYVKDLLEPQ